MNHNETIEKNFNDLSQTLIERRKRLHELASEINQWEDESLNIKHQNKKANQIILKKSKWIGKENQYIRQNSKDELVKVPKKEFCATNLKNDTKHLPSNIVNDMTFNFQNQKDLSDSLKALTLKSIIQKFEIMSKGVQNNLTKPLTNVSKANVSSDENSAYFPRQLTYRLNDRNMNPKIIIEKFESMARGYLCKNSNYSGSLTNVSSLNSNLSQDESDITCLSLNEEILDDKNYQETSIFEEPLKDKTDEKYSNSASFYTGSIKNNDEIDKEEYHEDEETEEDNDEYDRLNEVDIDEITFLKSSEKHSNVIGFSCSPNNLANNKSSSASSDLQPLSIKEYRKQKCTILRRSSMISKKERKSLQQKQYVDNFNQSKLKIYDDRINELKDLVKNEENIIHQTGVALERCINDLTATNEHIECNRLLLISCQKRQAYLFEINHMKELIVNKKLDLKDTNNFTGLLIFSDLQLPIKESYLKRLKSGEEKRIFYFLCLIRNGIQVLQTQVISLQELISNNEHILIFPNRMAINNVDINFKVKIDIYTLEVLTNTAINKVRNTGSNGKLLSPFRFQSQVSTQSYSNEYKKEQSSSTNQKAKTSNFIHVDTLEISQVDIYKNKFTLNISSSSIPLTGLLYVNIRCMPSSSVELKGFMSFFEDLTLTGFTTWERRWCFLNNYNISYWKYPEDEYRSGPLGIINLTKCLNEKISILPRDLCARKHSLELLIQDDSILKRFRLSADSKDQANDWLININFALANLRLWNSKSVKT
ncbi:unnamed protein product [Brachionus calyciflorus]|uniref:PH domain-containing protein n=1 Tax=Brachionus calyciflorus TaxID=104777 RepID=A0A814IMP4_9BILA|nr:unnamed protein product [Brachionus calyciflorus]